MTKYFLLSNGARVPVNDVTEALQFDGYFVLHFLDYGASLEQRGKITIVEVEDDEEK